MSTSTLPAQKILLTTSNGICSFWIDDIVYARSENSYTYLKFKEKEVFCTISLKNLDRMLSPFLFFRAHKSYLIHLNHIDKLVICKLLSNDVVWLQNSISETSKE